MACFKNYKVSISYEQTAKKYMHVYKRLEVVEDQGWRLSFTWCPVNYQCL